MQNDEQRYKDTDTHKRVVKAKSEALKKKKDYYGNPVKDMEERKKVWTKEEHIKKHTKRENSYNPSCPHCQ